MEHLTFLSEEVIYFRGIITKQECEEMSLIKARKTKKTHSLLVSARPFDNNYKLNSKTYFAMLGPILKRTTALGIFTKLS
jgi:hypothetical protein